MSRGDTKACVVCGREIAWRKKWERDWLNVRYCSKRCRARGRASDDSVFESAILTLLHNRASNASICPSEAAREVDPDVWRERMEDARMAARRLVTDGRVEILQRGMVVDPSTAKGPIRIRLVR